MARHIDSTVTVLLGCLMLTSSLPGAVSSAESSAAMQQQASMANSIVSAGHSRDAHARQTAAHSLLAMMDQPASSGAGTTGVGNAFVAASRRDPDAAAGVFANMALQAAGSNKQRALADSAAHGFLQAHQQGCLPSYVNTLTGAMSSAGPDAPKVAQTVAQAIATASATAAGKTAVANATATAICAGNKTAVAISQAVSTAVTIDPATGCGTVALAIANAIASCGSQALSNSKSFSDVFNTCNVDPAALANSIRGAIGDGSSAGNSDLCSMVSSAAALAALGCV